MWDAVKKLKVRGAPAIGVAMAYGIALLASHIEETEYDAFYKEFHELKTYLVSSRHSGQLILGARTNGTYSESQLREAGGRDQADPVCGGGSDS